MPQWLVIGISGVTCGGKTTLAHSLRDYFQAQRNVQLWSTPYVISDVQMISQDDYFLPVEDLRHKWIDTLNAINFELITSLDMKQMLSDITWTMKGRLLADDPMENCMSDCMSDTPLYSAFEQQQQQQPQHHHNHYNKHHHQVRHLNNHPAAQQHNRHLHHPHYANAHHVHAAHIMRLNPTYAHDNKINILIIEGFMIFNQPELLALCNIKFHFHLPYEKCFERRQKRTYDPPDVTGYFEICVWPQYEKNFAEFRARKDIIFLNGEMSQEKILKFVLRQIVVYFEERCDMACPPPQKFLGIPSSSGSGSSSSSNSASVVSKTCPMEQQ